MDQLGAGGGQVVERVRRHADVPRVEEQRLHLCGAIKQWDNGLDVAMVRQHYSGFAQYIELQAEINTKQ